MYPVVCRSLRREYRLHCPTADSAALLSFIAAEPELPGLPLDVVDIPIHCRDGFLVADGPGGEIIAGTATHVIGAMHRIVMADIVDGDPETPMIQGATVVIEGRRLLLAGPNGSGKSTLALHLAMAGHDVEGDEYLLVREHDVVARPRALRVKEASLRLIGGLPASVWQAPSFADWDGNVVRSLNPAIGGRPWAIRAGQLDAIVFLVANHGGRSVCRPVPNAAAFERLMQEVVLPRSEIAAAAGRLRRLALALPTYQLSLGDIDGAEWHLRHVASSLSRLSGE